MGPLKRFQLDRSQHTYQRGRSSENALHDLVSRIESVLDHKLFSLRAFLDVEGAFTFRLRSWARHVLIMRCISRFQGGLRPCSVTAWSCSQGDVLSTLLWNMVINSLLGCLNNESLWAQGFADDIAIVINGKCRSTVCEFMQKALFIVQI
jgi:hypothetical protein